MKTKNMDLTSGSIPRLLISFSVPFLLANLMQAVYGLTDTLIVGRFVGSVGLSGVSVGSQVTQLFNTIGSGLVMGGQIMIAQYKGSGDERGQREIIGTMFSFMTLLAILLIVVSVVFAEPILRLLNTPEESFLQAKQYLVICMAGMVFVYAYNAVCSLLRGLGDSKRPMVFVAIASVVNVVLDLLFIGVFEWGAAGAAAATVIAQAISVITAAVYLKRNNGVFLFDFKLSSFRMVPARLKVMLKVGVPFALQFSILVFSMLFIVSMVNAYGVTASAAYGVGGKIDSFATMPVYAVSAAASTMVGQNIGAGKPDRAKSAVNWCIVLLLVAESVIFLLVQVFARQLIGLFDKDPGVMEVGVMYLRRMAFVYLAHALLDSYLAMSNGVGYSMLSFVSCTVDGVALRILLAWLFGNVLGLGLPGIFMGAAIAPFGAALISGAYFYSGRWRNRALLG